MALRVPICSKLTSAQQHYVQISNTEFHTNRTVNVKNEVRNSFTQIGQEIWEAEVHVHVHP